MVTVRQSFERNLETIPQTAAPDFYRRISSKAPFAFATPTPYAYFPEDHTVLTDYAKQKLSEVADLPSLSTPIPQLEPTHLLHSEGDVVYASMLYLVHAVNIAASSLLDSNTTLLCGSELTSTRSRTDINWFVQDGESHRNIAVLEFKNTNVLHLDDFQSASAEPANAREKRSEAIFGPSSTLFSMNGATLSQQARKYSLSVAPHVALFDWEHMFIFDFSDMDEDAYNPRFCRGIWFTETDQNQNNETFRMVLLGFLIRALRMNGFIS